METGIPNNTSTQEKWHLVRRDLQVRDVVLLKDSQVRRTEWTVPSQDNRVRNVEIKVVKQGTPKVYL